MYSLDQELAFAMDTLKRQRVYIRELEDANTPVINTLKTRIAALEAIIAAAPHEEDCIRNTTFHNIDCNCWKSRAREKVQ